ncbi:S-layer protein [Deinococcus malanensis]|uniref:S-layer protein n=1 Tax=Deinococcus malanensis TaxID=1706855 RepID=A0ABQ2EZ51_9DEIO|nr:S-layer protein [Deinococcus malanensis]
MASAGLALLVAGLLGGGVWWYVQKDQVVPAARLGGDFHALRHLPDGRLLYGQHAGVSISTDGGRTWSPADGSGDAMALATSAQGVVMAGHDVLKVSRDGANSWQDTGFGNLPGSDIHGFAVAPGLPDVWYANVAGRGLYRTRNTRDWEFVSPATAGAMALAVGPGSSPRLYALTMDAGLVVSDDGTTWQGAGGAPQASGAGLDVHPVSGNVYIAGPSGVARSEDRGATWTTLNLPEGALLVTADPREERNVYAVGESGLVYRSADGGKTWAN